MPIRAVIFPSEQACFCLRQREHYIPSPGALDKGAGGFCSNTSKKEARQGARPINGVLLREGGMAEDLREPDGYRRVDTFRICLLDFPSQLTEYSGKGRDLETQDRMRVLAP